MADDLIKYVYVIKLPENPEEEVQRAVGWVQPQAQREEARRSCPFPDPRPAYLFQRLLLSCILLQQTGKG